MWGGAGLRRLRGHAALPALESAFREALPSTLTRWQFGLDFSATLLHVDERLRAQGVQFAPAMLHNFCLSFELLLLFQLVYTFAARRSLETERQRQLLYTLNRLVTSASRFSVQSCSFLQNVLFQRAIEDFVHYHNLLQSVGEEPTQKECAQLRRFEYRNKFEMFAELVAAETGLDEAGQQQVVEMALEMEPELLSQRVKVRRSDPTLMFLSRIYQL